MTPLTADQIPRWARWVMNTLSVAVFAWMVYCLVAWATHSGIWRITWDFIASHQRGKPDGLSIAFISMTPGFALVVVVAWPTHALLLRRRPSKWGARRAALAGRR